MSHLDCEHHSGQANHSAREYHEFWVSHTTDPLWPGMRDRACAMADTARKGKEIVEIQEALRIIQEAAGHWAEYLEENDRHPEVEPIDVANDRIDVLVKALDGG